MGERSTVEVFHESAKCGGGPAPFGITLLRTSVAEVGGRHDDWQSCDSGAPTSGVGRLVL